MTRCTTLPRVRCSVRTSGGPALAVEADPSLCAQHQQALPWVTLVCQRVSTRNLGAILGTVFRTVSARIELDVLKVDVDSFEGPILEEALFRQGLRPKVLLAEINAGIPPPLQFALLDSPQLAEAGKTVELRVGDTTFEVNMPAAGVSLSYLVNRLAPDYLLLELGSPDAVFVRADMLQHFGRAAALDEFEAFAHSWLDLHGFSRHQVRRWLWELDEVDGLGEVYNHLSLWMSRHLGQVLPFILSF